MTAPSTAPPAPRACDSTTSMLLTLPNWRSLPGALPRLESMRGGLEEQADTRPRTETKHTRASLRAIMGNLLRRCEVWRPMQAPASTVVAAGAGVKRRTAPRAVARRALRP
jgi:hypothetical protein